MLYRIVCCPAEPGRMLAANLPDWRERRPDCFLLLSFVFVASGDGSRIRAGSSSVQWGLGFSGRLVFQKGAKMKERLSKLLAVKSIVTIVLTIVFAVLAARGTITGQEFLTVFTVVISFYYGTQAAREGEKK